MMDQQTRELLIGSVREILARIEPDHDLAAALEKLGWDEVRGEDPAIATQILFTEHGRVLARTRALDEVVLAELESILPPANGRRAFAHPRPDQLRIQAGGIGALPVPSAEPCGIVFGPLDAVDEIVAVSRADSGTVCEVVRAADMVRYEPVDAFDRSLRWTEVVAPTTGGGVRIDELWPRAVAAARRALAAEILGISRAMLDIAVAHTSGRVQYGKAIGSFQSVRHRLAEAYAELVGAERLLEVASEDDGEWSAAMCKADAGRTQRRVAAHALQVCGALGLTQEFALHGFVARGAVLDSLYLSHRQIEEGLGRELFAQDAVGRNLPRVAVV
ncbi:acyl-CoA dehydrogenase family protein [Nocardia sp. NBC_01388]|uniref:acyl-CoA dehydrogenase family protein n=1 Tax=Nocardia sp. NBC_01388 TaxID=2903596 RepID=UPI00324A6588